MAMQHMATCFCFKYIMPLTIFCSPNLKYTLYSTLCDLDPSAYMVCLRISPGFSYMIMLPTFKRKHYRCNAALLRGCYGRCIVPGVVTVRSQCSETLLHHGICTDLRGHSHYFHHESVVILTIWVNTSDEFTKNIITSKSKGISWHNRFHILLDITNFLMPMQTEGTQAITQSNKSQSQTLITRTLPFW